MTNNLKKVKDYVVAKLLKGNLVYLNSKNSVGDVSLEIRKRTYEEGQKPYAVILSCSDSRVIPESIFSANIGDLFVIRVAGNIVDDTVFASVDYAVSYLDVKVVVVLGHTGCGAIKAAINGSADGRIANLIKCIQTDIEGEKDSFHAAKLNVYAGVKKVESLICDSDMDACAIGAIYRKANKFEIKL